MGWRTVNDSTDTVVLETETERREGVTLVSATVENALTTTQVVRLEHRLDGPVWPPAERGITEPEWEGETWRMTLPPGRSRGLGFASPADPVDPPLVVETARRATAADDGRPPGSVLAELDDWKPPRSVVERR